MLPKSNRLKKKKDIERPFKEGQTFKEDFLILKFAKNELKNSRFAFIISRKVSKKASLRNKIKRRIRELIRIKLKKIKKGIDAVIIISPGLETKDFWKIEDAINRLFEKAKIYQWNS